MLLEWHRHDRFWLISEVPGDPIEVRSTPNNRPSSGDFRFALRNRRTGAVAIESEPDPERKPATLEPN